MIKKLPDELIIATLTRLAAKSIISFCSTNHYYHELYNATNILQYIGELGKAGAASGCEDLGCKVISPFYIPSENFSSSRERRSYLEAGAVWTFAERLFVYVYSTISFARMCLACLPAILC